MAIAGLYANALEETLAAELWHKPYLEEVQRLCEGVDLLSNVARSMRAYRAGVLRFSQSLGKGVKFDLRKASLAEARLAGPPGPIMAAIPEGWIDLEFANYSRLFQFGLEGVDVTRQLLNAHTIDIGEEFFWKSIYNSRSLHVVPAQNGMPNFFNDHRTTARTQTLLNQTFVACGLERYRATNGDYAEKLEALVPQFATKLPHDLFDGQPLRHRRTDDGLPGCCWQGVLTHRYCLFSNRQFVNARELPHPLKLHLTRRKRGDYFVRHAN